MTIGAINSLMSGQTVSPISRWNSYIDQSAPLEPVTPRRSDLFGDETVARAEFRQYPRPATSSLSLREQEAIANSIYRLLAHLAVSARV